MCISNLSKNLSKYLKEPSEEGVVESFEAGPRMRVYQLGREYEFLRKLFKQA